jgi:hypothetical protein
VKGDLTAVVPLRYRTVRFDRILIYAVADKCSFLHIIGICKSLLDVSEMVVHARIDVVLILVVE